MEANKEYLKALKELRAWNKRRGIAEQKGIAKFYQLKETFKQQKINKLKNY